MDAEIRQGDADRYLVFDVADIGTGRNAVCPYSEDEGQAAEDHARNRDGFVLWVFRDVKNIVELDERDLADSAYYVSDEVDPLEVLEAAKAGSERGYWHSLLVASVVLNEIRENLRMKTIEWRCITEREERTRMYGKLGDLDFASSQVRMLFDKMEGGFNG